MPTKLSKHEVESFIESANSLARRLRTMAKDLDDHSTRCNATRTLGKASAVVGAGISILAAGLTPFTLGLSSAAVPVGLGMVAGGTAVDIGTSIVETAISNSSLSDAEKDLQKLKASNPSEMFLKAQITEIRSSKVTVNVETLTKDFTKGAAKVAPIFEAVLSAQTPGVGIGSSVVSFASDIMSDVGVPSDLVGKFVSNAGKVVKVGNVLSVIALPVSVADLIASSVKLFTDEGSAAGQKLRETAEALEERVHEVQEALEEAAEKPLKQIPEYKIEHSDPDRENKINVNIVIFAKYEASRPFGTCTAWSSPQLIKATRKVDFTDLLRAHGDDRSVPELLPCPDLRSSKLSRSLSAANGPCYLTPEILQDPYQTFCQFDMLGAAPEAEHGRPQIDYIVRMGTQKWQKWL